LDFSLSVMKRRRALFSGGGVTFRLDRAVLANDESRPLRLANWAFHHHNSVLPAAFRIVAVSFSFRSAPGSDNGVMTVCVLDKRLECGLARRRES